MKKALVVIEDDEDMRALIRYQLMQVRGLVLEGEAANADQAIELARRTAPDLVILDHFIEGKIMGLQAAPLIKEAAPGTRILLFSSYDLEVESSREPAIDRFLHKNRLPELMPTVKEMLELGEAAQKA